MWKKFILFCLTFWSLNILASEWATITLPAAANGISNYVSSQWISSSSVIIIGNKGGTIADGSVILRSRNKGISWKSANYSGGSLGTLTSLAQRKINGFPYLLCVGYQISSSYGQVYTSANNGSNWALSSTKFTFGQSLFKFPALLAITLGANGYAFASGKASTDFFNIFKSDNSNSYQTWVSTASWNVTGYIANGISTYDGVNVIAVGSHDNVDFTYGGVIFRSTDSGATWNVSFLSTVLYGVTAASSTVFYIGGYLGYAAKSSDAGFTWATISYSDNLYTIYSFSYLSTTAVYAAVSKDGTTGAGMVLVSTDSGTTWQIEVSGLKSTKTIAMVDFQTGIAGDSFVYARVTGVDFFTKFFNFDFSQLDSIFKVHQVSHRSSPADSPLVNR